MNKEQAKFWFFQGLGYEGDYEARIEDGFMFRQAWDLFQAATAPQSIVTHVDYNYNKIMTDE